MTCGNCGFPLPENRNGCRHFGTSIAHQEYECVDLLQREISALREAVRTYAPRGLGYRVGLSPAVRRALEEKP